MSLCVSSVRLGCVSAVVSFCATSRLLPPSQTPPPSGVCEYKTWSFLCFSHTHSNLSAEGTNLHPQTLPLLLPLKQVQVGLEIILILIFYFFFSCHRMETLQRSVLLQLFCFLFGLGILFLLFVDLNLHFSRYILIKWSLKKVIYLKSSSSNLLSYFFSSSVCLLSFYVIVFTLGHFNPCFQCKEYYSYDVQLCNIVKKF